MPTESIISVVDDDRSAREGTVDLIQSMGFVVRSFGRAQDFLEVGQPTKDGVPDR